VLDVKLLYERYGPMVLRRCRYMLRNEEWALDAMQDTFVKVLRYEKRLNMEAPSSLLYRIATNICLNLLRSKQRQPQTSDENILMNIVDMEEHESKIVNRQLLSQVFGREPASTKTMAVLHYVDGMTLQEVADEVGLSVSGVRKRLRRLKERAKHLHKDFIDDQ
jgi:RNA polymerase sigma-70 factor (ECF subfamily)